MSSRSPGPPVPESAPLYSQSFDADYFFGATNAQVVIPDFGLLEESWSGYALNRVGDSVVPFIVPALGSGGETNISSDTGGAFRFWVRPYWTSQSLTNDGGPGANAILLEFDAASGGATAMVWTLQASADGNTLSLVTQTSGGLQTVIQTSIAWAAGESHSIVLNYGPAGTQISIDDGGFASGSGVPSIPCSVGQLVIGSSFSGTNPAQADVEEFYSFGHFLSDSEVALYYRFTSGEAAKGPMPGDRQHHFPHHHTLESEAELGVVYDQNGGCSTGGPVYMTNAFAVLETNGTTTFGFDLQGGTNGILYDFYSAYSLSEHQWNWMGQGFTCGSYSFANQPADMSFYYAVAPSHTLAVEFGVTSGSVPAGLTNSVAVAAGGFFDLALQSNGTLVAWGDNTYGQTNVPSGITNAVSIAAGQYHALALLENGSVRSWGSYYDGSNFYPVTSYSGLSGPPTSNVMAIAAGFGHDLALMSNGTVMAWGLTNIYPTSTNALAFQTNLTGVKDIACGWDHNVALLSNGMVKAWGLNASSLNWNLTNVPVDLTNVAAISAYGLHSLALRSNGTVEAWGYSPNGETNVPDGLSNVVAIAAGGLQSVALQADGTVVAWGAAALTNVPAGLLAAKTISAGFEHSLVLQSGLLTPVIIQQPMDQYAPAGSNATFTVQAVSLAQVSYQWQFNGTNLTGETNDSMTLTNTQASDNGSYQAVASTSGGSIASAVATFTLVTAPEISTGFTTPTNIWIDSLMILDVGIDAAGQSKYPVRFEWELNGTNISNQPESYPIFPLPTNEGIYTLVVTNVAGSNSATWNIKVALPGMAEAWGDDSHGECDRPVEITNISAIAAGDYHSVAARDDGTALQWGEYSDGTHFYAVGSPPTFTNLVAVAASLGHDIGLLANGSVRNWGLTNDVANFVPTNLPSVKAIAAGWRHNVALLTNGAVTAWGDDSYGQTNVPGDLTNVTAIVAGEFFSLALRANGTVEGWGDNTYGQTSIPSGLSNIVAIAAGGQHSLALKSDGTVAAWGLNTSGQTNVPTNLSNVMAIAAGAAHSVALINDGSLVEWGSNSNLQSSVPLELTNITITPGGSPPSVPTNTSLPIPVKLIAAGGNHTMAAIFSPLVQYPIDVSKDLLLIYNTNSAGSSNVCSYYLAHRPMVRNANVLGIGCATNEIIDLTDYTNTFSAPILNWLLANPTKRPQYVVLFQDLPSRLANDSGGEVSVQYDMNVGIDIYLQFVSSNSIPFTNYLQTWRPFVTSINMNGVGGTNDCIAYINKIVSMASNNPPGALIISAIATGYGNTNWYFDFTNLAPTSPLCQGFEAVTNVDPTASIFGSDFISSTNWIRAGTNVAGYFSGGWDGGLGPDFATNGEVVFSGNSGWYIMTSIDSYNGQRQTFQSSFLTWWATNAFGGINYSNTPIGAITYIFEPSASQQDTYSYYGSWAANKNFAITAWNSFYAADGYNESAAVGDPFTIK